MIAAMLRLTRPYYTLPFSAGLIVIAAYIVGGDLSSIARDLTIAFASLFFVLAAGYTLNDVCDIAADTVNNPNRPLVNGQLTRKTALIQCIVLFAAGLCLAVIVGLAFFLVLTLIAAGMVLYDLYSKRIGLFKDLFAAVLMVSLYPLSFTIAGPVQTPRLNALYIFPVWLFLTAFGYEMLKDIRDIRGDSSLKGQSDCSLCSSPRFLPTARSLLLAAALLTVLPYLLGYCRLIYLMSSVLSIVLVILALRLPPAKAIPFIYAEVALITAGSMADLLVYGP